jgi:hypothetical protein
MATRNDITGDELRSATATDSYRDGWDRIFGKNPPEQPATKTEQPVIQERPDEDVH